VIIIASVLFGLPFLAWPLANVHLIGKYKHPAWIGWELMKIFFRNAGASLYTLLISLLMALPVLGALAALEFAGGGINPFSNEHFVGEPVGDDEEGAGEDDEVDAGIAGKIVSWFADLIGENRSRDSFMYRLTMAPIMLVFGMLVLAPITLLAGFPAIFMMRVNALLAHYNRQSLGVIQKIEPFAPAGIWIRFHAYCVDMCLMPLATFLVTRVKKAVIVGGLIIVAGVGMKFRMSWELLMLYWLPPFLLYNYWMYFAISESASQRTTIGKDVFKLIVVTEDNKQLTIPQATMRWFYHLFTPLIGILFAAFSPDKKTLYDSMSKTKVTYAGDK
jgi:uncharacterized RDD family membrane protein YckC